MIRLMPSVRRGGMTLDLKVGVPSQGESIKFWIMVFGRGKAAVSDCGIGRPDSMMCALDDVLHYQTVRTHFSLPDGATGELRTAEQDDHFTLVLSSEQDIRVEILVRCTELEKLFNLLTDFYP